VHRGNIYVARPPLYRVDVPALGKRPTRRLYCLDEAELDTTLEKLVDEKVKEGSWSIARFKGLGEMSPEQLWETTMNPDTRRLMRVGLGDVANAETVATLTMLMGRAESQARRAWLEEHGNEIEADV
jgi:topoisomerase-4 subunit B